MKSGRENSQHWQTPGSSDRGLCPFGALKPVRQAAGEISPGAMWAQQPAIGEALSERVADQLDMRTTEELDRHRHGRNLDRRRNIGGVQL
jgi:hypothetical protein